RIITGSDATPGIISSATADLDGDGKAEVAIAYDFEMNEPKRGKLGLAIQGKSLDDPWTFKPIADVPSIHRIRWGDLHYDKRLKLVVVPIFGPESKPPLYDQDQAQLQYFDPGDAPKEGRWSSKAITRRPVLHAIEVRDFGPGPGTVCGVNLLTADNLGS